MGNAITYHDNLRKTTTDRMSKGLKSFIEKECPIYLTALRSEDYKLKEIVVKQFNESFPDYTFENIYSILPYLERLRLNRIKNLNELTSNRFINEPKIKLSCLPCNINGYLTLSYFDTGCSISCLTLSNAKKLNLVSLIDYNACKGIAVGFGTNRQIIGFLSSIPVQFSSNNKYENELLFNINFVVINQANSDFILIGNDFMIKNGIKLDYLNGKLIFPKQIINEYKLDFMPSRTEERDLFFDLFKYEMFEHNRILMRGYFNVTNTQFNRQQLFDRVQLNSNLGNQIKSRNTNLYIRIQINGKYLFALIDTGADSSKISENLAIQLDLLSFIDYDKAKIAHGLGSIVSIGQLPPIPVKFESSNDLNNNENKSTKTATLFIPFTVLKEEILLLGSDFFTHYNCYLDFSTKSIDISCVPAACRCTLEEQETKNAIYLNDNLEEESILLSYNNLENNLNDENIDKTISLFKSSKELDDLRLKIKEKERAYQIKKKLKKYEINLNKQELNHLQSTIFLHQNQNDLNLKAFNFSTVKQILNNLGDLKRSANKLSELNEQTSSFLNDETKLNSNFNNNNLQLFKNQISTNYYNLLPEENSIVKINFVNKIY